MARTVLMQLSAKLYDTPEDRAILEQLQAHADYLDKSKLIKQLLRAYFATDPTTQAAKAVRQVASKDVLKESSKRPTSGTTKQAGKVQVQQSAPKNLTQEQKTPAKQTSRKLHKLTTGFDGAEY